jgi:hypothetical protein
MNETKSDVYTRISNRIVADLEQGVCPWHRPWNAEHTAGKITRPLRHNGIPYKGINVIMLWSASVVNGYACPLWLTFKQALELGGNVRKGERGALVVYADRITRTENVDDGGETERSIPVLKGYTVFNAEQCEGLPAQYHGKPEGLSSPGFTTGFAGTGHHALTRAEPKASPPMRVTIPHAKTEGNENSSVTAYVRRATRVRRASRSRAAHALVPRRLRGCRMPDARAE